MKEPVPRLDYGQSLLVSQINYTLTNFADHGGRFSHDVIPRRRCKSTGDDANGQKSVQTIGPQPISLGVV
ncbi:MAG TPA: hypothetical protein VJ508_08595, partial [Saprospiraceae bacterium]|nr:hypothetical protein [Saprospiraceae bacterium]